MINWDESKDSPSTMESVRDYLTDLQDLPEDPKPILRDQGIWSLICREMNVCISFPLINSLLQSNRNQS